MCNKTNLSVVNYPTKMFSDVFIEFCAVVDLRKLTGKTIVNRVALGQLKFKDS